MKKITKISIIILCLMVVSSLFVVNTYAKWKPEREAAQTVDIPGIGWNPSESYIVFAGLNSANSIVTSSDDFSDIINFAVVGYTGTVAELVIPDEITVTYEEEEVTGRVLQILAGGTEGFYFEDGEEYTGSYEEVDLKNNQFITYLYVPSSVSYIGNSVFMGCVNLEELELEESDIAINMGDYAFSDCISLSTVSTNGREISGVSEYIFYNTPYLE
jgi:hypothetical protein